MLFRFLCDRIDCNLLKGYDDLTQLQSLQVLERYFVSMMPASRFWMCSGAIQHGNTSVMLHCLAVAYFSLRLVEKLGIQYDEGCLVRGALLHDYFLYDWHEKDPEHRLHGFHHPSTALKRASEDFRLSELERDIILHHMFPLTLFPPRSREAMIVCVVDKWCGIYETVSRSTYPELRKILSDVMRLPKNV